MRFATMAEVTKELPAYLARAKKKNETIIVTQNGKPCALIQPISERELERLGWKQLAERQLVAAWDGDDDALYDYL